VLKHFLNSLCSVMFKENAFFAKATFLFSILALAAVFALPFAGPSFSNESIVIENLSKIKPFTVDSNYLSLEGYVISYCGIHYGKKISRGEARRIIRRSLAISAYRESPAPGASSKKEYSRILERKLFDIKKYAGSRISKFDPKKVVLLPFISLAGGNAEAADLVSYFASKLLVSKGYEVVNASDGKLPRLLKYDDRDLAAAAKRYNAEFVISGEIKHYRRYKRFRTAGFLLDWAFSSVHGYADVRLSAKVFSSSRGAFVFESDAYGHRKHQLFGAFHGTKGIMSYAVNDAVKELFKKLESHKK